jgi:hypothetical protein
MTIPLRWKRRAFALALAWCCLGAGREAAAQSMGQSSASGAGGAGGGRLEISGGVGWTLGYDLGKASATLSGNGVPTGTPVTLFDADTRVDAGPRFEARIGWRLSRLFALEGGLAVTRTHLRADISNDVEQVPSLSATSRFTEYAIEGGATLDVPALRFGGGRGRPFISGGAGYLRQLHEGATLVETGTIVFAGGGVRYVLRQSSSRNALIETFGLRGDARLDIRTGGFETVTGTDRRVASSVSGGVFARF